MGINPVVNLYLATKYLRTFPNTNSETAGKKHVEQLVHFVAQFEAEALSDHHVPTRPEFLIKNFFDHFGALKLYTKDFYSFFPGIKMITQHQDGRYNKSLTNSLLAVCFSQALVQTSITSFLVASSMSV